MFEKILYGLNKGGTFKVWYIEVIKTVSEYGQMTIMFGVENGTMTSKVETIKVGKQGRNAYEQAVFQAEARIKKQLDKNYRETKEELKDLPVLAMLAKDHSKDGKDENIEKGVYVSDKLDGVRCLAKCLVDGTITLESRTGQPWTLPHIVEELGGIMLPGDIFDGELYFHGPVLQDITSAVKRTDSVDKVNKAYLKAAKAINKHGVFSDEYVKAELDHREAMEIAEIREKLEFRVFDIVTFETPFTERLNELNNIADEKFVKGGKVVKVEYVYCDTVDDMLALHKDAVSRGYEGIMYRLPEGEYESGKRSAFLWKFKTFFDEEFKILRHHVDKNGYAVFELLNNVNDEEFDCVMGDYAWREKVGNDPADTFSGDYMTVQFQSRFKKTLLPQFPTGKLIREGAIIDGVFVPFE